MANLATLEVKTAGDYEDLATLASVTFTADTSYTIQIQSQKPAYLREGSDGDGFLITSANPFTYTAGADTLYIKADYAVVNIAD